MADADTPSTSALGPVPSWDLQPFLRCEWKLYIVVTTAHSLASSPLALSLLIVASSRLATPSPLHPSPLRNCASAPRFWSRFKRSFSHTRPSGWWVVGHSMGGAQQPC